MYVFLVYKNSIVIVMVILMLFKVFNVKMIVFKIEI